jgi:hypothetical protein
LDLSRAVFASYDVIGVGAEFLDLLVRWLRELYFGLETKNVALGWMRQ